MTPLANYISLQKKFRKSLEKIQKNYNFISGIRITIFLAIGILVYYYIKTASVVWLSCIFFLVIFFLYLLRVHKKISFERGLTKSLIEVNEDEAAYLEKHKLAFEDGSEFLNPSHIYSYDLDIFGSNSLFHHINRTSLSIGKQELSTWLLSKLPNEDISLHQEAIRELSQKLAWRQKFQALAKLANDRQEVYHYLLEWEKKSFGNIPTFLSIASYAMPLMLGIGLIGAFLTGYSLLEKLCIVFFFLNLAILLTQRKKIQELLASTSDIDKILRHYGLIAEIIEDTNFNSSKLSHLKSMLVLDDKKTSVSKQINYLSQLFSNLDSMQNPFALVILNGFFIFHIHVFRKFLNWKASPSSNISKWLKVIGNIEALNSLANFAYNNPSFTYPKLNQKHKLIFKSLGHPLINSTKRITNDVRFDKHRFFILTGSNMSGKSTFLRTVGVNMVLGQIGSPVCAKEADIHPLDIYVSLRVTDSLSNDESYFFAEVKRLKMIIDSIKTKPSLVLLDEILKGTNSLDKQQGTIKVIKKVISLQAIGIIATHDVEVCTLTKKYSQILSNKCFESSIVNDDLSFDYQLKDGICQTKSATFLMEKMQVIDRK